MKRNCCTPLALFCLLVTLLASPQTRVSAQTVTYVGGGTGFKVNNNGDICFSGIPSIGGTDLGTCAIWLNSSQTLVSFISTGSPSATGINDSDTICGVANSGANGIIGTDDIGVFIGYYTPAASQAIKSNARTGGSLSLSWLEAAPKSFAIAFSRPPARINNSNYIATTASAVALKPPYNPSPPHAIVWINSADIVDLNGGSFSSIATCINTASVVGGVIQQSSSAGTALYPCVWPSLGATPVILTTLPNPPTVVRSGSTPIGTCFPLVTGIDDNTTVCGTYNYINNNTFPTINTSHAYTWEQTLQVNLTDLNVVGSWTASYAYDIAIDNTGYDVVVGSVSFASGPSHAMLWVVNDGVVLGYTDLYNIVPGGAFTEAVGISNGGYVVMHGALNPNTPNAQSGTFLLTL